MTFLSSLSPPTPLPEDSISVTINGQQPQAGWQEIRITRSLERPPSSFDLVYNELYPTTVNTFTVNPGDQCVIKTGKDTILTGYVDSYNSEMTHNSHSVRISGRSKCQDMYDCSAESQQLVHSGLLELANALGKPYGITASRRGTWKDSIYPTINSNLTQSAYSIIEMVARYLAVLIYDDVYGNLVLSDVGAGTMGSGITQAVNAQIASLNLNNSGRFKTYHAMYTSVNKFGGILSDIAGQATDAGIKRERTLAFVSEQNTASYATATLRANYEANRRNGRGQIARVMVDSWRDTNGLLWEPNFFINLNLPAIKLVTTDPWVIAEVTYLRNLQTGTTAQIMMMPKQGFQVEPMNPTSAAGLIGTPGWQVPPSGSTPTP